MNSKDIATSTPNTIKQYDNYLKDYVNTSGFKWDSSCLDVAFTNLGSNFEKYVQKIGDYNTIAATNPQYTPPKSWQEKDYSGACPEGWGETLVWNYDGVNKYSSCTNQSYTGPCPAGRTKKIKRASKCPSNGGGGSTKWQDNWQLRYDTCYGGDNGYWNWSWRTWSWSWNSRPWYYSCPQYVNNGGYVNNQNYYPDFYGNWDWSDYTYCYTPGDYTRSNWQNQAKSDCANNGGTSDWGVNYCLTRNKYDYQTEAPSYFWNLPWSGTEPKRNWENQCSAYWPMKTINIPGKWTCQYGEKIEDDMARGNIINIGASYSAIEAAKNALKSNKMIDNYFAIIDNNLYIVGGNSNVNVIISKGAYQQNCTENNNRKIQLYVINQGFFDMLSKCKVMNDKINQVNTAREILQTAIVGSVKENFTNLDNIKDISKNQDEIVKNLASNYNKKAELYNYQIDVISQNEKLVETQNRKLNNQLDEMTAIQEQIALKDRVMVLNDELTNKQIRNKKILIGFFVLIPFLGIPFLLVVTKAFSPFLGISLAGLMIIGYIIYMLVVANQSEVKKFGREDKRIISKYEKSIANFWNKEKEALSKSLSKFVNGQCLDNGGLQEEEESGSSSSRNKNIAYPKGDYLMKSNGPFYYYDGSAPPQQIYPGATGSIDFNIEGENYKFPKDISAKLSEIKNPITKFFFETWLSILNKNGINVNDPRFAQDLDVIEFPDSDQTPMPFWDNIKLPIVTNINQQFNYLFQSYSKEKKNLSQTASVLLVDLWNFVFGNKIPGDVYDKWVNRLADVIKQTNPDIGQFYKNYLDAIMVLPKFSEKYGSGFQGLMKFVEIKMVDFIKTFNQDIHVSQPFAKRYVP